MLYAFVRHQAADIGGKLKTELKTLQQLGLLKGQG